MASRSECTYLHRLPLPATKLPDSSLDCFGREKFSDYRDDMASNSLPFIHHGTVEIDVSNHLLFRNPFREALDHLPDRTGPFMLEGSRRQGIRRK